MAKNRQWTWNLFGFDELDRPVEKQGTVIATNRDAAMRLAAKASGYYELPEAILDVDD